MNWESLSDEELLNLRMRDLRLSLEGSHLAPWVSEVLSELKAKGLQIEPKIYLGDEWFSPEGEVAVAVPFFLAHPRLIKLEKHMMNFCEGEKREEFLSILRHELGHAIDHAYRISRKASYKKIFGEKKDYDPDHYKARPYSRNFVHNIANFYAQAHPDEDFAETFAVWLKPNSNWRETYKHWGALKKLKYVDRVCAQAAKKSGKKPAKGRMISDVRFLTSSLAAYYARRRKNMEEDRPEFFDKDLLRIFSIASTSAEVRAAPYFRTQQEEFIRSLDKWSQEKKYFIASLYKKILQRMKSLDLVFIRNESESARELLIYLATLLMTYRWTGRLSPRAKHEATK